MTTTAMRLSIAVMTHPRRARAAERLADRFRDQAAQVVLDPEPDGPPSALRAARRAWAAADPEATHHLVLQDDALPVAGCLDRLASLVAAEPDAAFSLHAEWGSMTSHAIRLAAVLGHTLAPVVDDYIPCVALVLPVEAALGFEEYARTKVAEDAPDDVAMLDYLADRNIRALIPVANLVDHHEALSLVGNNKFGPRPATCLPPADTVADGPHSLLTGLDVIPYYDFWGQYSDALLPDDSVTNGWVRTSARDWLLGRGITREELTATLEESLARRPESDLLRERISEVVLTELWIVAFLHGVVAAGLARDDGASLDLTGSRKNRPPMPGTCARFPRSPRGAPKKNASTLQRAIPDDPAPE
ncbi:hypothetical protein OHQ89_32985 [Streptomyces canus]|uniref:hypothetical protein n=1 Tax=Streptomyces canus TaxID=58343 RepID=UPI0030E12C36